MNFIKNKDLIYPFLLCLLIILISVVNYFYFGNFLYDCGREFLVPEAMNDGSIPIKEIFLSYFPLSYQINALLFKIFGSSLDILRVFGIFCSCIISVLIYFISKEFLDCKKSLFSSVVVCFITMFNVTYLSSYVLSYSYAFIYGVLSLFISLFFALKFIKEDKFLYWSYFFLGVCFSLKAEFVFLVIPYFIMLIYKKAGLKKIIFSHLIFISPIFLSFGMLFLHKFNLNDFKNYAAFLSSFMNSEILKFYSSIVFLKEPSAWISHNFKNFIGFLIYFILCLPFLYLGDKFKNKFLNAFIYIICTAIVFTLAVIKGGFVAGDYFSWGVIFLIFIFGYSIRKKNFPLSFLSLISIFLTVRFNFIYTGSYLSYTLPFGLLVICIFLFNKNKFLYGFLIIFSLVNVLYFTTGQKLFSLYEIKTEKGKMILQNKENAKTINETLFFIENETAKNDEILILPEGMMFNYLADRKTDLRYYQLLPNHIEALKEENIVNDLKVSPPNYIMVLNNDYSIYGTHLFCKNFGQKICEFTYENYEFIKNISNGNLKISIYKLK